MEALIAVLPGDGIGPEVTREAVRVLERVAQQGGHRLELTEAPFGGAAIDAVGAAFPVDTMALVARSDAVLLGAIGGPQWGPDSPERPEQGLLDLRAEMKVFANIRPVKTRPALFGASPLRPEFLEDVDILVVRELTGGIYFGDKQRTETSAIDECLYTRDEVTRVVRMAAGFARGRRGKLTSVDKANVLETSRLWRSVTDEIMAKEFSDIELETLLVDAAAMHLLSRAADFDVIVTENMFGDILTDEASMLSGSMGLLPSASLNDDRKGLYEPIHGSAPDIAGRGIANPCGTILSAALLLRYSLGLEDEASAIETAVYAALEAGHRTGDVAEAGQESIGTAEMGDAILDRLG